ncbi:hypothetical protein D3C71_2247710 [compost metagenome]
MPDIVCKRFANIGREWHTILLLSFATHQKLACSPVYIADLDCDHFGRAQTEASHQ